MIFYTWSLILDAWEKINRTDLFRNWTLNSNPIWVKNNLDLLLKSKSVPLKRQKKAQSSFLTREERLRIARQSSTYLDSTFSWADDEMEE